MQSQFKKIAFLSFVAFSTAQAMEQENKQRADGAKPVKLISKEDLDQVCHIPCHFPKPLSDLVYDYAAAPSITYLDGTNVTSMDLVQHNGKPMLAVVKRRDFSDRVEHYIEGLDPHTLKSHKDPYNAFWCTSIWDIAGCGNNLAVRTSNNVSIFNTDGTGCTDSIKNDGYHTICGDQGIVLALKITNKDNVQPQLLNPWGAAPIRVFSVPGYVAGLCPQGNGTYLVATDKGVWDITTATGACKPSPIKIQVDKALAGISPIAINNKIRIVGRTRDGIFPIDGKKMKAILCDGGKQCVGDRLVQCGPCHAATACADGVARIYDLTSGSCVDAFDLRGFNPDVIRHIAATRDGSLLVAQTAFRIAIIRRGGMWVEDESQKKSDAAQQANS